MLKIRSKPCARCDCLKRQIKTIEDVIAIQSSTGNYDYDAYMHGMANGMILIHSILVDQTPDFLNAPKEWLRDKPESYELSKEPDL